MPVAGLVVVTDGADNAETTLDQPIAALKAQGMPVFAVGVGKDRLARDVQVTRVETPRQVLKGSSLVVDVVVTQTGFAGAKVPLIVEEEGRTIGTQEITLAWRMANRRPSRCGSRRAMRDRDSFRFKIPVQASEEVEQNNQRESLIDVHQRREKILFVDGEPRPEPKFVRMATDKDDNLQVVLLAAHGVGDAERAGQVLARRRGDARRVAGRVSHDARRAVQVSRHDPRQLRGGWVYT